MKNNWNRFGIFFSTFLLLLLCKANKAQSIENDFCSTAQIFDQILADGDTQCITGSNIGANAELPYISQLNCMGNANFSVPADDVWYQFTSQGNLLDVTITSDLDILVVALYEKVCDSLVGRFCTATTTGSIIETFAPVAPNETYFIQVSGGSVSSQDEFEICLTTYESFDEVCISSQTLDVSPLPYIGTYEPGQEVTFCLNVGGYVQNASDWLHGIVPVFGEAWDLSTLAVVPPESCDGVGFWEWYDEVDGTGGNAIGPQGPGFFYERTTDESPPNPGNNFGDNSGGLNCDWQFCFTISTATDCPPGFNGQDLSITFNNYSDSETGSWSGTNSPCLNDSNFIFKAALNCCPLPSFTITPPTCSAPTMGAITALIENGFSPYTFEWSTGFSEVATEMSLMDSLTIGVYEVSITDNNNCETVNSFTLENPNIPNLTLTYVQATICPEGNGQLSVEASGAVEPYTFTLMDHEGNILEENQTGHFLNLSAGNFTIQVASAIGCLNVVEAYLPNADLLSMTVVSNAATTDNDNGSIEVQGTGGLPPYMYGIFNGVLQTEPLFTNLTPGTYFVQIQDFLGCQVEQFVTIEAHVVGVDEVDSATSQFELGDIYPNPSKNIAIIPIVSTKSGEAVVIINNILGQNHFMQTNILQQGAQNVFINTLDLVPGIYFLEVQFEDEKQVKKLVVR